MDSREDGTVCLGRGVRFSVGRNHLMGQDGVNGKVEFVHQVDALVRRAVDLGFAEFSFVGVTPEGNANGMGIQAAILAPAGFACVPSFFRVIDELGAAAVSGYEIMVADLGSRL